MHILVKQEIECTSQVNEKHFDLQLLSILISISKTIPEPIIMSIEHPHHLRLLLSLSKQN